MLINVYAYKKHVIERWEEFRKSLNKRRSCWMCQTISFYKRVIFSTSLGLRILAFMNFNVLIKSKNILGWKWVN